MALVFSGMKCPQEAIGLRKLLFWHLALFQGRNKSLDPSNIHVSTLPSLYPVHTDRQEATRDRLLKSQEPTAGEGEQVRQRNRVW